MTAFAYPESGRTAWEYAQELAQLRVEHLKERDRLTVALASAQAKLARFEVVYAGPTATSYATAERARLTARVVELTASLAEAEATVSLHVGMSLGGGPAEYEGDPSGV